MQTTVQSPTPPAAPFVYVPGGQGPQALTIPAPRTAADIDALRARREELSTQLQSVDGRRSKLMNQLKQTRDETAIHGLQARLALLDTRQLQLETDLAQTGEQLSSISAGMLAGTSAPPVFAGLRSSQVMTLSVLSIILVFFPMAFGAGRALWKRASRPGPAPAVFTETAQRLERLEASVDAIAFEVERISEGQRFVTKLLSESQPAPMLGAGQRTPDTVRGS